MDWGAHCLVKSPHGFWFYQERDLHINLLEFEVSFFTLQCFAESKTKCDISIRIDNITAIS